MPRRTRATTTPATPKKLKQKKLDTFLSSSPLHATTSHSSPARPTRRENNRRRSQANEGQAVPGSSSIRVDQDGSQSSDAGAIHFEPQVVEISSSEGEGNVPPRPTATSKGRRRLRRAHSEESASPATSGCEDEQEIYIRKGKRATKTTSAVLDSDEDEEVRPTKKRKLVKGERPASPGEDEAHLLDEVDEERIIESRMRTRDKRSAFQKNLERLKRKKRGEATLSESSASEGEGEDEEIAAPFAHAHPGDMNSEDEDAAEEEDDTFIVEDDTSQAIELPAEFSMNTYQDTLHHFKIVCQMFVHMAVRDPDEREDVALNLQMTEYFAVPLKITRRKLSGMRDSLVAGSTWKPNFRKALDTYPDFELQQLEFSVIGCDACNLGARKSTLQGRLSGDPYIPLTYESMSEDHSDADEDEGSDGVKKQFDLGRFCAKRTRTYHQFTHWEYHLFHALRDEVDTLKASRADRSFVRVAYANGRQPPEDLNDADAIMDWLDERQIITIQWQHIKTMMDNARHLEVKVEKGGELESD